MRAFFVAVPLVLVARLAVAETAAEPTAPLPPAINVTTDPPAELMIDGQDCGVTPAFVEVSPGRHDIVLTLWGRTYSTTVVAVEGEVAYLAMRLGGGDEAERAARREAARARLAAPVPEPPWVRRVPVTPIVEFRLDVGPTLRDFEVPINPELDSNHRLAARFESGPFALVGFRLAVFPFARNSRRWVRGLGLEGGAAWGAGLRVYNFSVEELVSSAYSETATVLVYAVPLGRPDRGATLTTRFGWQRTSFYLGDIANDIVPPFKYDSFRLDAGLAVPLGTRHLLLELALAYLPVLSVGADAALAYSEPGTLPACHGGEVRAGLTSRVGGLEIGLIWVGRFYRSEFQGIGTGWGFDDYSTRWADGENGIQTMGYAVDAVHEFRFSLGYRY